MKSKPIPSTLISIKRQAKQLKASGHKGSHSQLLNLVSNTAGYANFQHARNVLTKQFPQQNQIKHIVYLTAYWKDKKTDQSGRETLAISLTCPWTELLSPSELNVN